MLILVEHHVQLILLINPQSWPVITPMLPYVVMIPKHIMWSFVFSWSANLDLGCALVKEYVHIKTSSSIHLPMCPTIHNESTCIRDIPCSLVSSSNELSPQLKQGSDVFHDKIENSIIIERTSHSPSSLDAFLVHFLGGSEWSDWCWKFKVVPSSVSWGGIWIFILLPSLLLFRRLNSRNEITFSLDLSFQIYTYNCRT